MMMQHRVYTAALNHSGQLWGGEYDESQVNWMEYIERTISFIENRSKVILTLGEFMETGELADEVYLLPKMINIEDLSVIDSLHLNYLGLFDPNIILQWYESSKALLFKNYNLLMGNDFRTFFKELETRVTPLANMGIKAIKYYLETKFPIFEADVEFILVKMNDAEAFKQNIKRIVQSMSPITTRMAVLKMRMAYDQFNGDNTSTEEYNQKMTELIEKIKELSSRMNTLLVLGEEIKQIMDELEKKQRRILQDVAWYFQYKDWIDV